MSSEVKIHNTKKRTDIENIREGMLESELQQFSIAALRKFCKQASLDTSGNLEQLVSRIFRHLIIFSTKENFSPHLVEKRHLKEEAKRNEKEKNHTSGKKHVLFEHQRKRKKGVTFGNHETKDDDDNNSVARSVHYFSKSDPPSRNFYDVLNAIGDNDNDNETPRKKQHIAESPVRISEASPHIVQGFSIFDETLPMEKALIDTGALRNFRVTRYVRCCCVSFIIVSTTCGIWSCYLHACSTERLTSAELTEELSKRGLSTSGTKKEKLLRLECYLSQQLGTEVTKNKTYQTRPIKSPPKWLKWR